MTGAVTPSLPERTHRISIGIAGMTMWTQHIALGSHTAINIPDHIAREFIANVNPAHPITIKVEALT